MVSATLFLSACGISASFYNRKNADKASASPIYNVIQMGAVFLLWLVKFLLNPEINLAVLPYSFLFALGYVAAMVTSVYAYREGSLVLSSLIMQLSMITTSIWGFFVWNSPVTPTVIIGLVLVVLTLWLCLYPGKQKENEKKKITPKWILFISIYFVGNSLGSIVQRTQQLDFKSEFGDFLMVVATGIGFAFVLFRFILADKRDLKAIVKGSWYLPAAAGSLNFFINFLVITLATSELSPTLVYPFIAVGSLALNTLASLFVFKEKMRWWQWVGVAVGTVAIVLLSI